MYQNLKGTGFWTEVQRIIGYNKTRVNTVAGVQGGDQIAEIFREKYDSLYNSVSHDDRQMATLQEEIELAVMTRAEQDRSYTFTISDIDSCMLFVKSGKISGPSGYSSDHIINGTRLLRTHITLLFNSMIVHGFAPDDFKMSTMVPIPKNKRKSLNYSSNYRAEL